MSKLMNLKKAAWYAVENITTIAFGLISVIIVARIFGPENLGKLSMLQALSATAVFLVVLGFDHLIVRDIARKKDDYSLIFTAFVMQFIGWCCHVIVVFGALYIIFDGDVALDIIVICLAVLFAIYFSRANIFRLFFQAVNMPRKIAISALISRTLALIYLAFSLLLKFEYHWVVLFIPIQAFLQFLILLAQFISFANVKYSVLFLFDFSRAKSLLSEATPLIASSILFPIFMQADILLISSLLDERSVGIYSSASRIITQFVFLGHIITMTFYLTLSNKFYNHSEDTDEFIKGLILILILFGGLASFTVHLFSETIISLLYGEKFEGAGAVLAILSWNWIFIFPAALFSRLLILKGLAKFEFIKSAVVATFSLSANYFLIPIYGITGAAIVSVTSYLLADLLLYSLFKETRSMFLSAIQSINLILFRPKRAIKLIMYTLGAKQ